MQRCDVDLLLGHLPVVILVSCTNSISRVELVIIHQNAVHLYWQAMQCIL